MYLFYVPYLLPRNGITGEVQIIMALPDTKESLPTKFDSNTNIKWKCDLPGPSAGTPIINDQFVFISSIKVSDEKSGKG